MGRGKEPGIIAEMARKDKPVVYDGAIMRHYPRVLMGSLGVAIAAMTGALLLDPPWRLTPPPAEAVGLQPQPLPAVLAPPRPTKPVDPPAEPDPIAAEMRGQVHDAQGRTLAATLITRLSVADVSTERSTPTDADGNFIVRGYRDGDRLLVRVEAEGYAPSEQLVNLSRDNDLPVGFTLSRPSSIEGIVLGRDGQPLANAPLMIRPSRGRTIIDAQGRFRFDQLAAGTHFISYPWDGPSVEEVRSGRWKPWLVGEEPFPRVPLGGVAGGALVVLTEARTVRDVTLDLSRSTATITGRVTDKMDKPIIGNEVYISTRSGAGRYPLSTAFFPPAVTAADGRYELRGLPPGDWTLRSAAPGGYRSRCADVPITLQPGTAIRQDLRERQ